jgi:hypothetical protein
MTITRVLRTFIAALICAGFAAEARADGFVSPFLAVNFGGDAGGTFDNNVTDQVQQATESQRHSVFGFSLRLYSLCGPWRLCVTRHALCSPSPGRTRQPDRSTKT